MVEHKILSEKEFENLKLFKGRFFWLWDIKLVAWTIDIVYQIPNFSTRNILSKNYLSMHAYILYLHNIAILSKKLWNSATLLTPLSRSPLSSPYFSLRILFFYISSYLLVSLFLVLFCFHDHQSIKIEENVIMNIEKHEIDKIHCCREN